MDLGTNDPVNPKFGNHWARRKADQVARDTMVQTGTSEETIDDCFGWNQKARRKKQQIHYQGTTEIVKLANVTMML